MTSLSLATHGLLDGGIETPLTVSVAGFIIHDGVVVSLDAVISETRVTTEPTDALTQLGALAVAVLAQDTKTQTLNAHSQIKLQSVESESLTELLDLNAVKAVNFDGVITQQILSAETLKLVAGSSILVLKSETKIELVGLTVQSQIATLGVESETSVEAPSVRGFVEVSLSALTSQTLIENGITDVLQGYTFNTLASETDVHIDPLAVDSEVGLLSISTEGEVTYQRATVFVNKADGSSNQDIDVIFILQDRTQRFILQLPVVEELADTTEKFILTPQVPAQPEDLTEQFILTLRAEAIPLETTEKFILTLV